MCTRCPHLTHTALGRLRVGESTGEHLGACGSEARLNRRQSHVCAHAPGTFARDPQFGGLASHRRSEDGVNADGHDYKTSDEKQKGQVSLDVSAGMEFEVE